MKLEVKNIFKSFEEKEVLHGVSFSVESGKALGLLGRNGAGKTTSLRIIMDVFRPNSGEILLEGSKFRPDKNFVGYMPEERGLYPKKGILEQMIYLGKLRGLTKKEAEKSAMKWLERLSMDEFASKKLEILSKGNQQKIQLAATLVGDPNIVILDEPFSGLDPVNAQVLKEVVGELISSGKIVIFSSHQMSYVEEFCEDIVIIDKGEVVLNGNLSEIKKDYGKHRWILRSSNINNEKLKELLESELSDCTSVVAVKKHYLVLEISQDIKQFKFLEKLEKVNVDIELFGIYEPSLNDIFVAKVGEEIEEVL